jgi:hypothetical protein
VLQALGMSSKNMQLSKSLKLKLTNFQHHLKGLNDRRASLLHPALHVPAVVVLVMLLLADPFHLVRHVMINDPVR